MNRTSRLLALLAGSILFPVASASAAEPDTSPIRVYIGTFTWKDAKGIYVSELDRQTGALSKPELAVEAPSPSFLALHPNHRFMYSVNEMDAYAGKPGGAVTAYSIDPASGKLTMLNRQSSAGGSPTHISLDAEGKDALVANYGTGSVAVFPIENDGKLAEASSVDQHGKTGDPDAKPQPHAHCVNVDPSGRFALSCDLGLDSIFLYRFEARPGKITREGGPIKTERGAGPRHLAFSADGHFVYVINELGGTVDVFHFDPVNVAGGLIQSVSSHPDDVKGSSSGAEILLHPNGKFLYVTNRADVNDIAAFRINPANGKLTLIGFTPTEGKAPRGLGIDPSGRWMLAGNQDTNNVVVFKVNPDTGEVKPAGVNLEVPTPVCFTFFPLNGK